MTETMNEEDFIAVPAEEVSEDEIRRMEKQISVSDEIQDEPVRPVLKSGGIVSTAVGDYSEDIAKTMNSEKSAAERYYDLLADIRRLTKTGGIVTGTVAGVERFEDTYDAVIIVRWNGIPVRIPSAQFFMPDFIFGRQYEQATGLRRYAYQRVAAEHQLGALCHFVFKGVRTADVPEEERLPGQPDYRILAAGSRTEAMKKIQDIYFFHTLRSASTKGAYRSIETGKAYRANILSVREDCIRVELAGVETTIPAFNCTGLKMIDNCQDHYEPGDTIIVRAVISEIRNGKPYLILSGRHYDTGLVTPVSQGMAEDGIYIGTVRTFNSKTKRYTISLDNGVIASCSRDHIDGNIPLVPGDKVSFRVKKIAPTHVVGNARKIGSRKF